MKNNISLWSWEQPVSLFVAQALTFELPPTKLIGSSVSPHLGAFQVLSQRDAALFSGNVLHMCDDVVDGSNGCQVDANDGAGHWHVLGCHLAPATRSCTEIQQHCGGIKEVILLVQLDQLES